MSVQAPPGVPALISDLLKGGRDLRLAQVEMAVQVERGIAEELPVLLEAATGTGKTIGYLVPLLRSGKTAIVSTANKALQDQIFFKDVPFLQTHIRPFGAVMMKGVGSYVCRDRLHEAIKDLRLFDWYPELGRLVDMTRRSYGFSGDFDALDFAVSSELRGRVNGDRDQCAWSRCDFFSDCYVRRMRDTALNAQVIIVNHTLLLLDAAADGAILPHQEGDVLIIDEAHHLADEATSAFTVSVRPTQLSSLLQLRAVREHAPEKLHNEVGSLGTRLWASVEQVQFGAATKVPFREPIPEALELSAKLVELADALRLNRPENQTEKEGALYDKLLNRVKNLANNVQLVFAVQTEGKYVHYLERVVTGAQRSVSLQVSASPLDVAPFLKEKLFDKSPHVVMTSATLATIGKTDKPEERGQPNFAYFRKQVGLTDAPRIIERVLPMTFDYPNRALLYIPRDVPPPVYGNGPQVDRYVRAIANQMYQLVLASRGRAFLLFSSRRMLDEVHTLIAPSLPFPVLSQGNDMSRAELTRRFRQEEGSVLFGLKSFWEGVDIAGDALSLVVIDKLPFGVPDDPVHEARVNQMKANNEDWFGEYVLPSVVLQLKQGVGRLLRTRDDSGVMAILDMRLVTKRYGRDVLNALPPARRTTQLAEVVRFFAEGPGARP